jgi:hypothetical protein
MPTDNWEPTGWWRATTDDGAVWCESSDETEVRQSATSAPGPVTILRLMRRTEQRWDVVG